MAQPEKILIVDDSADDAELVVRTLRRGGHQIDFQRVDNAETMRDALEQSDWDIVIADWVMPGFSGLEALKLLRAKAGDLPCILVSGTVGEDA